ncbi:ras-related protein Rab-13-like [Planoprotostelium fungivorum]|uniref:Ras-related protein Rab-13-like n=1 Tax=Planoprotostelium fungivorum TaxID=1890364 RepID=A0A2P6N132_9EUKA|nr:ras-related protein Rab-13-like [Planoprotostelium fungivorum]
MRSKNVKTVITTKFSPRTQQQHPMQDPLASTLKLCFTGDWGVGKTCLLLRMTEDRFVEKHEITFGGDHKTKQIEVSGKLRKVNLYDTAGQERFKTITTSFYRGCQGIIVVYDITQEDTIRSLDAWIMEVQRYLDDGSVIKCVVVANKIDCLEDPEWTDRKEQLQQRLDTGKAIAQKHKLDFYETSAKENIGVEKLLLTLLEDVVSIEVKASEKNGPIFNRANLEDKKEKKKKSFC